MVLTPIPAASASDPLYFLKTAPHPTTPNDTRFANRYLRHHGSGINAIMVMPSSPKFLRFHPLSHGHQVISSWKHPGRAWGLCLDRTNRQWEEVQIVENSSELGFTWVKNSSTEVETLEHSGDIKYENRTLQWSGWMVCEWAYGHPQLFWVTNEMSGSLPEICERVVIVKEAIPVDAQEGAQ
jgi:hypothetical protein